MHGSLRRHNANHRNLPGKPTGEDYTPAYYILIAVLISLPIIWRLPKLIDPARLNRVLA
ncbi:hypothetical protein [Pseudovibrio axinellae]|uniref:hypothetical protein n=1 Tax=Pseudovibrio axinellae TaxID=989403 RepID=UPI000A56AC07|nr:hypothetical protein [Pseudovibrio axinellae]